MKNLFKKILSVDPRVLLGVGFVSFAIGLLDTWWLGNGYALVFWWSKLAMAVFGVIFLILTIRFFIMPLGYWIYKGVKKLFNK